MKKTEAEKLVNETFTQPYDEDRFRLFFHNLFHSYERLNEKPSTGQYIWEAFRGSVISYQRLAKFNDPEGMELDVLAVKLSSRRTLENARTMQRNFIARYLNGSRGGVMKDAALVAFYSDDCDDWRFSLVRMDYEIDEKKEKVKKTLTPARRYSFLVGRNEGTHTARRQLLPVLQSATETTLAALETAFNIETVTKEFFEQYKALYLSLKNELTEHLEKDRVTRKEFTDKNIETPDFAKRLLGQVVFLYFLQKKGWLGVEKGKEWGTGPKDFLQRLYKQENYDNFFNDVLEHLFYDALATERQTQDHFYLPLNCKIPFLNGGLFEPFNGYAWDDTDILLNNAIFGEIFEVFDLYNFTVREDEPLDKEVAVDPEMLGKVFENLIPDNERKGSGTYYTPREIVHYMCQESLINYLDAELNIESRMVEENPQQSLIPDQSKTALFTKYEDVYTPHVPREDIAEFIYHGDVAQEHDAIAQVKNYNGDYKGDYRHKIPESVRSHAQVIDDALTRVKICDPAIGSGAFPVGIMNEIVRARSALNAYLGNEGRTPYDFKRHAIQESIYGVDIEPSAVDIAKLRLWLSLIVDEEDFGNIQPLPNLDYKIVSGNSLLGFPFDTSGRTEKLRQLTPLKEKYFYTYSPSQKLSLRNKINEIINSEYNNPQTEKAFGYTVSFDFRWSFFEVFEKNGGFDIFIANPPYIQLSKQEGVSDVYKKYLKCRFGTSGGRLNTFIFFIHLGIEMLSKQGVFAYIIPNTILTQDYYSYTRQMLLSKNRLRAVVQYEKMPFENAVVENVTIVVTKGPKDNYQVNIYSDDLCERKLVSKKESKLLLNNRKFTVDVNSNSLVEKILSECDSTLDMFCHVNQGIALKGDKSLSLRSSNEKGEFYKLLDGRNINRYSIKWSGVYLDYDLDRIHSCKRKDIFETREKLFFRRVSENLIFTYDDEQYYALNTLVVVNVKEGSPIHIKCLLTILNSRLMNYLYRNKFKSTKRVFSEIQARTVKQLPIPKMDRKTQEKLVDYADRIISLNKSTSDTNTNAIERNIDRLVYDLYDLKLEEIAIIEEAVS